jgi:hypothetical protein
MTVAGVCAAGYVLAGVVHNVFIVLGSSALVMLGVLVLIKVRSTRKTADETQTDNDTSQQP